VVVTGAIYTSARRRSGELLFDALATMIERKG
jgi:hypothetical protein